MCVLLITSRVGKKKHIETVLFGHEGFICTFCIVSLNRSVCKIVWLKTLVSLYTTIRQLMLLKTRLRFIAAVSSNKHSYFIVFTTNSYLCHFDIDFG